MTRGSAEEIAKVPKANARRRITAQGKSSTGRAEAMPSGTSRVLENQFTAQGKLVRSDAVPSGTSNFPLSVTLAALEPCHVENAVNDHVLREVAMNAPIPLRPDFAEAQRLERQSWHRVVTASALAALKRSDPADVLKSAWPTDQRAALILRAAQNPTSTNDFPAFDKTGLFQSLAPSSAALQLFERGLQLDLAGITTIRIPNFASLPPAPIFIGEGKAAPNVHWTFEASVLGPAKKVLILAAVTGELEAATPESASAIVGKILADGSGKSIDAVAFGTIAADDDQPAGLLHDVTPIPAAAAGPDAMAEDLGALIGAIGAAGIDTTGAVFVCSPREATIIKAKISQKFDHAVLSTLGLAARTIVCVAPAGLASGYQDAPQIEVSRTSAIHYEDTSPADIVGPDGVLAVPTKSGFQTNLVSIRVRTRAAWAIAVGAGQFITGVNW